ncbi:GTPase domain-containing protein [Fibrella aquatilis]|uniref:50S ribosome-binding GTPase n=1 Tax=Fibrella aquatilis TaxID=2817059 RepID=A0A939G8Z7_9BACT|nr:GTPase domain-containing protein [Fibrella aquatilis]MBO0932013.1 50S ribosome-binding GTPase [Fibrella aquatilis]
MKDEMALLQKELQEGLDKMLAEVGNKLNAKEKAAIQQEVDEIIELIERLKTGLIWIALFGRTSVGKSAIANSIIGEDIHQVGVEHDLTDRATPYRKEPWMIVDVPGILGKKVNAETALEEARKAHGHIFVVEEEPFDLEIELFDLISNYMPDAPRVVFVNKFDRLQHMTKRDRDMVIQRIKEKMRKYVKRDEDIVFGSAQLKDDETDEMVRQKLPQLEDRLYADAGTLGQIVNVLDPAKRAADLSHGINNKIVEIRKKVARRVIQAYAIGAVGTGFIPFDSLIVAPAMYGSLAYALVKIMGGKEPVDFDKKRMAIDILKACATFLGAEFIAVAVAETITSALGPIGWMVDWAALSFYKYKRTLIFGEATLLYIANGFTFGNDARTAIEKAKQEASQHYASFSKRK